MFITLAHNPQRKRIAKTIAVLVAGSCFFNFSCLVNIAYAYKIDSNTLALKKTALNALPEIKPPRRSSRGEKISGGNVMLQPDALIEYVGKIQSIEHLLDDLENKIEDGEDTSIDRRLLIAALSGLKKLRREAGNNFDLMHGKLEKFSKRQSSKSAIAACEALAENKHAFEKSSTAFFQKLENMMPDLEKKNRRRSIKRLRRMLPLLKQYKERKPAIHKNPPAGRSRNRVPTEPRTESMCLPVYASHGNSDNNYSGSGSTAPNNADLQETIDITITPEIRDLAARLNRSPARIFEWVKNNIQAEFYYGSLKGAQGTLRKLAGNDTDTSSLLMALLRAANVPCRYVVGMVQIPMAGAQALTGIEHAPNVGRFLANAGIPVWNTSSGDIRFEHTWVEAYVDYLPYRGFKAGTGDTWVPLSPWYKMYENNPGADLTALCGFDREAFMQEYMQSVASESPLAAFKLYFENWFEEHGPGSNWQKGLAVRTLTEEQFPILPATLNMDVVAHIGEYAELPADMRHSLAVEIPEADIAVSLNVCDIAGKKITFSYPPADNATRKIIEESGGLENVFPLSVDLSPVLAIEGEATAVGTTVNAGFEHTLRTTFFVPGFGHDACTYSVVSGGMYVVGIDPLLVSNRYLSGRIGSFSRETGAQTDEGLFLAMMKYFQNRRSADREIADLENVQVLQETSGAVIGRSYRVVTNTFGLPVALENNGYFMDAKRDVITPVSIAGNPDREKDFMYIRGYNSSFHEHAVFEDFLNLEAVSTIKLLQIAADRGMPIYDIDESNIDDIIPLLGHDGEVVEAIENAVNQGLTVTVHEDPLQVEAFQGCGYIQRHPETHAAGYMLSGGTAGAASVLTDMQSEVIWKTGDAGTTCGNPVSMASGNKFQEETDLVLTAPGIPLSIKRYYNSFGNWNGAFGPGWTFTYDEHLTENSADGSVVYRTADGRVFTYTEHEGAYRAEPGNYRELTKSADGFILRDKNGTKRLFDAGGRLTALVDRNENTVSLTYTDGILTSVTGPAGRTVLFSYNEDGKIAGITAPGGNVWTYDYEGQYLVGATDNAGRTVSYTYRNGYLSSRSEPEGKTVVYDYYENGRVHTELLPNGSEIVFSYNAPLAVTTVRGGCCSVSHHYHNKWGLSTGYLDARGYEELYAYDDNLNRIRVIDKNGGIVKSTYDDKGNVLAKTDQLNQTTHYAYDPEYSRVLRVTDAEGNTTINTYDDNGNLVKTVDPEGVSLENDYYDNGLVRTTGRNGMIKAAFTYYADGSVASVTDSDNNTSSFSYDELGRLTGKTDANGHTTSYELDKAGNILTTTDAEGNKTHFTYNGQNLRTTMTDARGSTTTYDYNSYGKLIKVTDPMGFEKTYTYTEMYELETETDKNGNTTTYIYDELRRVVEKRYGDGSVETFSYDPLGNILRAANEEGAHVQGFDAVGRLINSIDTFGQTISYSYYADGNRKSMTDPLDGVTQYIYNESGQIASIIGPSGKITQYYYQDGLLQKTAHPNATETFYEYDRVDRIISITTRKQSGDVVADIHYEYDAVGNRISMTDNEGLHTYQYDRLDQVVRVEYPDGTFSEYTYDPAYNRQTLITPDTTIQYAYDDNNRLLSAGGVEFSYDNNGNQTGKTENGEATSYQFDVKNRLAGITCSNGAENVFTYNAFGQRITRQDSFSTTHYLYDGQNVLMETNGEGVINSAFVNGVGSIGPLYKKNARDEYTWFVKDALGTSTHLTNEAGDVTASYTYDIFGSVRSSTVIDDRGIKNQYTGKELDDESGLMYFGARYYNPEVGRFISADTYTWGPDDERGSNSQEITIVIAHLGAKQPENFNIYNYTKNSPTKYVDPDGHFVFLVAYIMIGLVISSLMLIVRKWTGTLGKNQTEVMAGMFFDFATGFGLGGILAGTSKALLASIWANFATTLLTEFLGTKSSLNQSLDAAKAASLAVKCLINDLRNLPDDFSNSISPCKW